MGFSALFLLFAYPPLVCANAELRALVDIKASLDPVNGLLASLSLKTCATARSMDSLVMRRVRLPTFRYREKASPVRSRR
ncbi:hypothetical protein U1Q18_001156 [Sarracenia purpurea var. burkii]